MILYLVCGLAGLAGLVVWDRGSVTAPAAAFLWGAGLTLLAYGLVRDVWLILRGHPEEDAPKVKLAMTCFESMAGMGAVALGLGLHGLGWTPPVALPLGAVMAGAAAVVAFGHATRDWVLILVVVPNHRNLIPTWRPTRLEAVSRELGGGTSEA